MKWKRQITFARYSKPVSVGSGVYFGFCGVLGSALLWLISFKVVAYWLGPAGVGLYSQLRQIAQAATIGATFGGTNAVVQGLSAREDEGERQRFRTTASRLISATGGLVAMILFALAPILTRFFLSSSEPGLIASMRWLGFAVLLNVGATYVIAVLNGYRAFRHLALAQISGPFGLAMALGAAYFLQVRYRPEMLVWVFLLCFGISYGVGAWGIAHLPRTLVAVASGRLALRETRAFVEFALANCLAALSTTIALLLIRSWIIESRGLAFAGLFDAGWTLTFNYTTLFLTACSTVYLPLMTRSSEPESQSACMLKTAYLVLAGVTLVCYLMVSFKTPLILLLYSSQFDAAGNLLVILAVAVIVRGVSWVYGMILVATRNSRLLLLSDLFLNAVLLTLIWCCLRNYPTLEALGWAFVAANLLYLAFIIEYVKWKNSRMQRRRIWPLVALAALPLVMDWGQAQWVQLGIGFAVSAIAWRAHKKVTA